MEEDIKKKMRQLNIILIVVSLAIVALVLCIVANIFSRLLGSGRGEQPDPSGTMDVTGSDIGADTTDDNIADSKIEPTTEAAMGRPAESRSDNEAQSSSTEMPPVLDPEITWEDLRRMPDDMYYPLFFAFKEVYGYYYSPSQRQEDGTYHRDYALAWNGRRLLQYNPNEWDSLPERLGTLPTNIQEMSPALTNDGTIDRLFFIYMDNEINMYFWGDVSNGFLTDGMMDYVALGEMLPPEEEISSMDSILIKEECALKFIDRTEVSVCDIAFSEELQDWVAGDQVRTYPLAEDCRYWLVEQLVLRGEDYQASYLEVSNLDFRSLCASGGNYYLAIPVQVYLNAAGEVTGVVQGYLPQDGELPPEDTSIEPEDEDIPYTKIPDEEYYELMYQEKGMDGYVYLPSEELYTGNFKRTGSFAWRAGLLFYEEPATYYTPGIIHPAVAYEFQENISNVEVCWWQERYLYLLQITLESGKQVQYLNSMNVSGVLEDGILDDISIVENDAALQDFLEAFPITDSCCGQISYMSQDGVILHRLYYSVLQQGYVVAEQQSIYSFASDCRYWLRYSGYYDVIASGYYELSGRDFVRMVKGMNSFPDAIYLTVYIDSTGQVIAVVGNTREDIGY